MKTTELKVIVPTELQPVIKDTKIEASKAEQHAMAFAPSMGEYLTLAEIIKGLNKTEPTIADAKQAREARLKMVKVRTGAEEIKDLRKEGIKAEGDLIQALFNVVKNSCIVTETEFTEIEKHQERQEQKRIDDLVSVRKTQLERFGQDFSYLPLGGMTDDQFARLINNETIALDARVKAANDAELARVESERLAEEQRLADIEKDRLERIAQAEENERLRKENEAKAAEILKERVLAEAEAKRLSDIAAKEREAAEAERKKQQAIIDAQQAEIKAKQEAAEKSEREAKEKAAFEQADKEAKEKQALLAPDKEKVSVLHAALKAIVIPEFMTTEGKEIGHTMREALDIMIKGLVKDSKKLL